MASRTFTVRAHRPGRPLYVSEVGDFPGGGLREGAGEAAPVMPGAAAIGVEPPGPFFEGHGFQTERLMASHGLASVFPQETLELADRDTVGYQYLLDIAYETATDPTMLGLAWHLLYIARKHGTSGRRAARSNL